MLTSILGYHVMIIGAEKTGKTSLARRYVGRDLNSMEVPYMVDRYETYTWHRFLPFPFIIYDTPTRRSIGLRESFLNIANVCILCYSVDDHKSFRELPFLATEVSRSTNYDNFIVVANKADLRQNPDTIKELASKNLTPITTEEGTQMATQLGAYAFLECSVILNYGVDEVFKCAIDSAIANDGRSYQSVPDIVRPYSYIRRSMRSFQERCALS